MVKTRSLRRNRTAAGTPANTNRDVPIKKGKGSGKAEEVIDLTTCDAPSSIPPTQPIHFKAADMCHKAQVDAISQSVSNIKTSTRCHGEADSLVKSKRTASTKQRNAKVAAASPEYSATKSPPDKTVAVKYLSSQPVPNIDSPREIRWNALLSPEVVQCNLSNSEKDKAVNVMEKISRTQCKGSIDANPSEDEKSIMGLWVTKDRGVQNSRHRSQVKHKKCKVVASVKAVTRKPATAGKSSLSEHLVRIATALSSDTVAENGKCGEEASVQTGCGQSSWIAEDDPFNDDSFVRQTIELTQVAEKQRISPATRVGVSASGLSPVVGGPGRQHGTTGTVTQGNVTLEQSLALINSQYTSTTASSSTPLEVCRVSAGRGAVAAELPDVTPVKCKPLFDEITPSTGRRYRSLSKKHRGNATPGSIAQAPEQVFNSRTVASVTDFKKPKSHANTEAPQTLLDSSSGSCAVAGASDSCDLFLDSSITDDMLLCAEVKMDGDTENATQPLPQQQGFDDDSMDSFVEPDVLDMLDKIESQALVAPPPPPQLDVNMNSNTDAGVNKESDPGNRNKKCSPQEIERKKQLALARKHSRGYV